jgi:hypothetical protein
VIAAVSSITVCVVSSLLCFVIGYACGHKRRGDQEFIATRALTDVTRTHVSQPNPMILYEEILPVIESKSNITNQLELEDNVAYNPLK